MPDKQWYDNKALFEQMLSMKEDFHELQFEMKETRTMIKKYNGLYGKVADVKAAVAEIEAKEEGRQSVGSAIRNWGGWIFGLASFLVLLFKTFYGGM